MHKSHVATHPIPRAQQRDPRWSPHDPIFRHTRTNTTRPAAENGSAKGCSAPGTHRRQARALAQTLQTLNRRCSCSPIQCLSAQRCFTNPWAPCTAPPRFDPCLGNLPRTPLGLGEVQDGRRASGGPRKERWLFIWLSRPGLSRTDACEHRTDRLHAWEEKPPACKQAAAPRLPASR